MNTTGQTVFPDDFTILIPSPLTDSDIENLYRQEPLPPNQGFQLPAEEFPSDDDQNENQNQPTLNYHEH